ncbi:MAG TPA: hypothetical protein EYO34_01915 [Candidatus Marinimicrobia bacterium]|nr:hypothetical protein [Candidatus Neomarinimicrobiota bacterium]HIB02570.1 hypothetical protein [Candidatus Neomarinimicrobiota bacterium]HIB70286.1 hypothetical protein [Candidatus Neomarinimicrobiota bacterium]HIB95317.1 hypothetical protein [Candidatus Neomarinimicrobiota bacterium]HIN62162.1 hypothetical protein [Candidatus Neomarinimicrobiota bacterium]
MSHQLRRLRETGLVKKWQ